MPVGLLVNADRKARHVRSHHTASHFEEHGRVTLPSFIPGDRLNMNRIGDEIRFDHAIAVKRAFTAEVTLLSFEPLGEDERIVDDEILGTKQIEHQRRRCNGQQAGLAIALTVKVLIPGVQRNREKAPCLPLEALPGTVGLPYGRSAPAIEHIIKRLVNVPLSIEALAGWYSADVGIIEIACSVEHDVHAVSAHTIPPPKGDRVQIFDEKPSDDIDTL